MENKARCVYETRRLFKDIYGTEIKDRNDFKKYNSYVFSIAELDCNEDYSELSFSLEKANDSQIPYVIVGEPIIKQFVADVVGYFPDNPNPESWFKYENMMGKKIEVFVSGGAVKGISPVFGQRKNKFSIKTANAEKIGDVLQKMGYLKSINPKNYGNRPEDWKLEDIVGEDFEF